MASGLHVPPVALHTASQLSPGPPFTQAIVGALDGRLLFRAVGSELGEPLGLLDRVGDGFVEGSELGRSEGFAEGLELNSMDGEIENSSEGVCEGIRLGKAEGL